jgi:PAS domain S-box-containing protein
MQNTNQTSAVLDEHLKFESLLSDISANLVNLPYESIDPAIELSMKKLLDFYKADRCHLGRFSAEQNRIIVSHFYSKPGINIPPIKDVGEHFLPFVYDRIRKNQVFVIENIYDLPEEAHEEREYFKRLDLKSMVLIPLIIDDVVEYGLSLSTVKNSCQWKEHTINHIQIIGNLLANVLRRKHVLEKFLKEQRWTEAILQSMPHLAYVFDKELKLKRWNKNVEKVLGYNSEELYDKYILDFVHKPDHEEQLKTVKKMFETGEDVTAEERLVTKSGRVLPYYGSGSLTVIDDEPFMIGLTINMSELKSAQKQIEMQLKEIKRLKEQLEAENLYLREELKLSHTFEEIIGESNILKHILYRIEQVAPMDTTVLLKGETGTGKELFARAIHQKSKRHNKPMIAVNCASLPVNLVESELFGHEKGAFTGAMQRQIGRFELADGGTIFLDEIGELPMELQAKLLRVLQAGEFERIGNPKTMKVDVRVITATNCDLEKEILKGRFRKDLFYRLNVYPLSIAPLRERASDIPLLVEHFVKRFNHKLGKNITKVPQKVIDRLKQYDWPGNIRELENIIERAVILSKSSALSVEPLQNGEPNVEDKFNSLADYERKYIEKVLKTTFWRIEGPKGAARILDMNPKTLRSRMQKLGIIRPQHI